MNYSVPECMKREIKWMVAEYCCYDKDDTFESFPTCCASDAYRHYRRVISLLPVIILTCVLLPIIIFWCFWYFNRVPALVKCLTCGVIKMRRRRTRKTAKTTPDLYSNGKTTEEPKFTDYSPSAPPPDSSEFANIEPMPVNQEEDTETNYGTKVVKTSNEYGMNMNMVEQGSTTQSV